MKDHSNEQHYFRDKLTGFMFPYEIGMAEKQMLIDNMDVTRQSWAVMRRFCYVMCCSEVVIDSSRLAWQHVVQWSKAAGWML